MNIHIFNILDFIIKKVNFIFSRAKIQIVRRERGTFKGVLELAKVLKNVHNY